MEMFYDLTNPQKSILITEQYYTNTNINNITGYFNIEMPINVEYLKNAINIFIQKNEGIRTRFLKDNLGNIKQYFTKFQEESIEVIKVKNEQELENLKETISKKQFNIFESKLYSFYIYNFNDKHGGIIFSAHHLIWDAWTMSILINSVASTYFSLINHQEDKVQVENQYKDYIVKEKEYLISEKHIKDMEYWKEVFSSKIDIDNKDIENDNIDAERYKVSIGKEVIEKLGKIDNSFFNIYTSALAIYFTKISNLKSLLVGVPVLNRANYAEKQTAGMFVNTVPFRIDIDKKISFNEFVRENKNKEYKLFKHQRLSYEEILKIAKENNPDINYLFDIVISYQNARDNRRNSSLNYNTGWIFNKCISNSLDIHITDLDDTGILNIVYDYQTNKYSQNEIKKIHNRIMNILKQVIDNENVLIKDIEIVTEDERKELLSINSTKIDYPESNVIEMFLKQVKAKPEKIAISFENEDITYKELDLKSDKIAGVLLKQQIKKSDPVGILLPRSLDLFASILGVLKAGLAYLPIDIDFPDKRIEYMLKDSNTKICITTEEQRKRVEKYAKILKIEDINKAEQTKLNYNIKSTDSCYIIYTSGSTGEPKGIVSTHDNIINYTYAFQNEFKLSENDTVLQQFTPSFDAFSEEFYPALLNGVKIFAVSKKSIYNLDKLEEYINENNITLISCSPLLLNEFNKLNRLKTVRTFISGGDVLKKSFYSNLIKYADIYNTYGPTETTVCSTYHKCNNDEEFNIPIGRTIANYKNFIVSEDNQLLPKGIVGELCIGGKGVSKGYLSNKELTNQKFITLPIINEKVYKTGDLCKINSNNEIEFVGRKDCQLKIRGYRISLEEIEKAINQYPGINNSLVIDFEDKSKKKRLCAYYVGLISITDREIKEYLKKVLPNYMIPSVYIRISGIPININGKIEKNNLPNPLKDYKESEYIKPSTRTQKKLEDIWKEILNVDRISIEENLFEIGVDSLSIIEFQTMTMNEKWNLDAQDIYANQTIEKLAYIIDESIRKNQFVEGKYKKVDIRNLKLKGYKNSIKNILLTGSTGFLGIHVLNELLKNTQTNIYCLVRGKDYIFAEKRLKDLYEFYFDTNIQEYKERIKVIYGDITKENFGISEHEYEVLNEEIDTVIHTAATVKHYGNEEVFHQINVIGTKNVIDFCIKTNSQLHYISTISVSGQKVKEKKEVQFSENDFWIGQNYQDNVYIKSKFEAEYLVFNAIEENDLYAKIYRIGNLTGRYRDGVFQKNIDNNAFYKKIQTVIKLKKIPNEMANLKIDFTPVDLVSEAIRKVIFEDNSEQIVYHMYNDNLLAIKEFINILNKIGFNIEILSEKDGTSKMDLKEIGPIIYDIHSITNKTNINVINYNTQIKLKELNFEWNKVDKNYLLKIMNYLKKIKFVEEK